MNEKTIDLESMPAFALFSHLGKTTMQPGGMELSRQMMDGLKIGQNDCVVEFDPGRGTLTRLVLDYSPKSYTAVARNRDSQEKMQEFLSEEKQGQCVRGKAATSGLNDGCASVVFGELMFTMRSTGARMKIAKEAFRLLKPGGRYGIHESCLTPDDLSDVLKNELEDVLNEPLLVRARPLTMMEWQEFLEEAGFEVKVTREAPMRMLELRRMVKEEGVLGAASFVFQVLKSSAARRRISGIRWAYKKYGKYINAVAIIAVKPK